MRAEWDARIEARREALNLAERFEAEGRSWVEAGPDGKTVRRSAPDDSAQQRRGAPGDQGARSASRSRAQGQRRRTEPPTSGSTSRAERTSSASLFRDTNSGSRLPWLRTGDLGYLHPSGELVVCGRIEDAIIINGRNVYAADLEWLAEKVSGVRRATWWRSAEARRSEGVIVVAEATTTETNVLDREILPQSFARRVCGFTIRSSWNEVRCRRRRRASCSAPASGSCTWRAGSSRSRDASGYREPPDRTASLIRTSTTLADAAAAATTTLELFETGRRVLSERQTTAMPTTPAATATAVRTGMVVRHDSGAASSSQRSGLRTEPHDASPLSIHAAANQIAELVSSRPATAMMRCGRGRTRMPSPVATLSIRRPYLATPGLEQMTLGSRCAWARSEVRARSPRLGWSPGSTMFGRRVRRWWFRRGCR